MEIISTVIIATSGRNEQIFLQNNQEKQRERTSEHDPKFAVDSEAKNIKFDFKILISSINDVCDLQKVLLYKIIYCWRES